MNQDVKKKKNFEDSLLSLALENKGTKGGSGLSLNDGLKLIQLHEDLDNLMIKLENKRKEIEERSEILKAKWYQFYKKQKKFEERVNKHLKEIEDKKEKKDNILKRAVREEDLYRKKQKEIEKLTSQLQALKKFRDEQAKEIEWLKPAQQFLKAAFMKAPESYFDSNVNPAAAVILRHKSQTSNKEYLLTRLAENTDKLLECQQNERKKREKHQQEISMIYTKISELQKKLEYHKTRNIMLEDKLKKKNQVNHEKNEQLLLIVRAVENLSSICEMHMPKLKKKKTISNPVYSKLNKIEDFLLYKSSIIEHAKKLVKAEMELRVNDFMGIKTSAMSQAAANMSMNTEHSVTPLSIPAYK